MLRSNSLRGSLSLAVLCTFTAFCAACASTVSRTPAAQPTTAHVASRIDPERLARAVAEPEPSVPDEQKLPEGARILEELRIGAVAIARRLDGINPTVDGVRAQCINDKATQATTSYTLAEQHYSKLTDADHANDAVLRDREFRMLMALRHRVRSLDREARACTRTEPNSTVITYRPPNPDLPFPEAW
jgi:hypothetical protein